MGQDRKSRMGKAGREAESIGPEWQETAGIGVGGSEHDRIGRMGKVRTASV